MPRALLLGLVVLVVTACAASAPLAGTELDRQTAPDFTLLDGVTGRSVSLSSLRGGVVALAFLYTRCPDVCPLTAERFRMARDRLGADAARVTFVAVSVDPENDTPRSTQEFTRAHRLGERWYYLIGPRASLQAVWSAYGVGVEPRSALVEHNDAIFLIDPQGRERLLVHSDNSTDELVGDIRALLGGR